MISEVSYGRSSKKYIAIRFCNSIEIMICYLYVREDLLASLDNGNGLCKNIGDWQTFILTIKDIFNIISTVILSYEGKRRERNE